MEKKTSCSRRVRPRPGDLDGRFIYTHYMFSSRGFVATGLSTYKRLTTVDYLRPDPSYTVDDGHSPSGIHRDARRDRTTPFKTARDTRTTLRAFYPDDSPNRALLAGISVARGEINGVCLLIATEQIGKTSCLS